MGLGKAWMQGKADSFYSPSTEQSCGHFIAAQ